MHKISLDSKFGQSTFMNCFELGYFFKQDIFNPKDLGVSYMKINYWDKQGILSSNRKGKTAWRNFNFIDYIWLRVIDDLRELGVPTRLIKEAKRVYFEPLKLDYKKIADDLMKVLNENKDPLPFSEELREEFMEDLDRKVKNYSLNQAKKDAITNFFYCISLSITERTPVSLILFLNGDCDVWIENQKHNYSKEFIERCIFETHIAVSISKIIKDFLMDERSTFLLNKLPLLQPNEIRLMELIHSGSFDSITINFKDKKMNALELKKTHDVKRRIVDVLNEASYQVIEIKSHKGMVTKIENTVKEYLSEK